MKLIHIKKLDRYIDLESKFYPNHTYTDDDLDLFMKLESEYKENIPCLSFYQLIDLFDTARSRALVHTRKKIKNLKEKIKTVSTFSNTAISDLAKQSLTMDDEREARESITRIKEEKIAEINQELASLNGQIKYLKNIIKKDKLKKDISSAKSETEKRKAEEDWLAFVDRQVDGLSAQDIDMAKTIPISNFLKIRRDNKVNCIYHNERTPSMHIYKNNHFYCFSCGKYGSVIDVVMQLQGLDFKEAVNTLLNK